MFRVYIIENESLENYYCYLKNRLICFIRELIFLINRVNYTNELNQISHKIIQFISTHFRSAKNSTRLQIHNSVEIVQRRCANEITTTLAQCASNTFNRASRASTRSPNCLPRRVTPQGPRKHGDQASRRAESVCTGVSTWEVPSCLASFKRGCVTGGR